MKEEQARGNTQAAVRKTFQEAWRQVHPVLSLFSNNALPTLLLPAPARAPPPPPPLSRRWSTSSGCWACGVSTTATQPSH